jgi:short-subunit dehydrogenase
MSLPKPRRDGAALVTGASSGIGEAFAANLAGRGFNLVLVARSAGKLEALAEDLRRTGVRVEVLPADLSSADSRAELPARLAALGLAVDVLVNNAGLSTTGPVAEADVDAELNVVNVDIAAVVDLCTRFLPDMVHRRSGAILNVASTAAFQPLPGQSVYGAAKAFVKSYTEALAAELRGSGVTVTALCPGPVDTAFVQTAGFRDGEAEGSMPGFMWRTPGQVAKTGIDGLARGSRVVIPGLPNQASARLAGYVPHQLLVPLLARNHPALKRRR